MVDNIGKFNRINPMDAADKKRYQNVTNMPGYGVDFGTLLREQLNKNETVQFSKHAKERVEQRGIDVSGSVLEGLNDAIAKAREKGARDVVVIGQQGAFIVNVPNNIVVTAMSGNEMKDNIFTNIDSAVIL